jgi:hypothetical protein
MPYGTAGRETGPLVTLLQSYGKLETLVVGPWGNGSSRAKQSKAK